MSDIKQITTPNGTYDLKDYIARNLIGATDFSTSSTYAVGDLVIYDSHLYRCIVAVSTAGAWNSSSWELTSIDEELEYIRPKAGKVYQYENGDGAFIGKYPILLSESTGTTSGYKYSYKTSKLLYDAYSSVVNIINKTTDSIKMLLSPSDITLAGTDNTWDGTNTSLKDSIGAINASLVNLSEKYIIETKPVTQTTSLVEVNITKTGYTPVMLSIISESGANGYIRYDNNFPYKVYVMTQGYTSGTFNHKLFIIYEKNSQ